MNVTADHIAAVRALVTEDDDAFDLLTDNGERAVLPSSRGHFPRRVCELGCGVPGWRRGAWRVSAGEAGGLT
jgi:hypothetical protein